MAQDVFDRIEKESAGAKASGGDIFDRVEYNKPTAHPDAQSGHTVPGKTPAERRQWIATHPKEAGALGEGSGVAKAELAEWGKNATVSPVKSALGFIASPITGLFSAPGEVYDWAKRGGRNEPGRLPESDNPFAQAYGAGVMAFLAGPGKKGATTPLQTRLNALRGVPETDPASTNTPQGGSSGGAAATIAAKIPKVHPFAKFLAKRIPGVGTAIDVLEAFKEKYGENLDAIPKVTRDELANQLYKEKHGVDPATAQQRVDAIREMRAALKEPKPVKPGKPLPIDKPPEPGQPWDKSRSTWGEPVKTPPPEPSRVPQPVLEPSRAPQPMQPRKPTIEPNGSGWDKLSEQERARLEEVAANASARAAMASPDTMRAAKARGMGNAVTPPQSFSGDRTSIPAEPGEAAHLRSRVLMDRGAAKNSYLANRFLDSGLTPEQVEIMPDAAFEMEMLKEGQALVKRGMLKRGFKKYVEGDPAARPYKIMKIEVAETMRRAGR